MFHKAWNWHIFRYFDTGSLYLHQSNVLLMQLYCMIILHGQYNSDSWRLSEILLVVLLFKLIPKMQHEDCFGIWGMHDWTFCSESYNHIEWLNVMHINFSGILKMVYPFLLETDKCWISWPCHYLIPPQHHGQTVCSHTWSPSSFR